jgi:hypothetical protein
MPSLFKVLIEFDHHCNFQIGHVTHIKMNMHSEYTTIDLDEFIKLN